MIKAEILEALSKLNAEERREIRAKLNELDNEAWSDNGEISEREKAIIEARLDEYDQNPETGSSCEEAKARVLADCIQNELPPAKSAWRQRRMWRKRLNGTTSGSSAWVRNS